MFFFGKPPAPTLHTLSYIWVSDQSLGSLRALFFVVSGESAFYLSNFDLSAPETELSATREDSLYNMSPETSRAT